MVVGRVVEGSGVRAGDALVEHRVTETVDGAGELRGDPGVDRGVVADEDRQARGDPTDELVEYQVLVLHLIDEAGGLVETLTRPLGPEPGADHRVVDEKGGDVLHHRVVLGVKRVVDGREADVLVHTAVARDVVSVEVLVVVVTRGHGARGPEDRVGIGLQRSVRLRERHGRGHGVVDERVAGAHRDPVAAAEPRQGGAARGRREGLRAGRDRGCGGAGRPDELAAVAEQHHRHAIAAGDELAVLVGRDDRDAADVVVAEVETKQARLRLHVLPRRQAAVGDVGSACGMGEASADGEVVRPVGGEAGVGLVSAVEETSVRRGHTGAGREGVLTHEEVLRRVRAITLALVDVGRGGVDALPGDRVGAAGEHHEVGNRGARDVERVALLERDVDRSAGLGDQVEAVVVELAEEGEPGVVPGRHVVVRGDVRDLEDTRYRASRGVD